MRLQPQVRKLKAVLAAGGRVAAVLVVTLLGVSTAAWATWTRLVPFVEGHEYFRLRSIRVSCDNPSVPAQTLAELGGLYDDSSLWKIDPASVEKNLREESWIRDAHVTRRFPWQVSVDVARRHPVAAAVSEGKVFLVDGDGVLFQEVERENAPDLVYLTGWDDASAAAERASRLKALLAVLTEAGRRNYQLSELHMDADAVVWMFPSDLKASVRLGAASHAREAFDRLALALKEIGPFADQLRSIDADYDDRVVVRGVDDKFPALLAAHLDRPTAANSAASAPLPSTMRSPQEAKRRHG